jgi:hypothetical protein
MGTKWVKWYFIFFYYFAVIVGINVVVAFAIDMYDSVSRLDEERQNTIELLRLELVAEREKIEAESKPSHYAPRVTRTKIEVD